MEQILQFITNHWILWLIFIGLIGVILFEEIRGRVRGVAQLQPQELTLLINREQANIIDVRDSNAFLKGHIIGSINIPHTQLESSQDKLEPYKDKTLVIVCAAGQTAPIEGAKLKQKGFADVYFLSGGISAWQNAGLPLTRV